MSEYNGGSNYWTALFGGHVCKCNSDDGLLFMRWGAQVRRRISVGLSRCKSNVKPNSSQKNGRIWLLGWLCLNEVALHTAIIFKLFCISSPPFLHWTAEWRCPVSNLSSRRIHLMGTFAIKLVDCYDANLMIRSCSQRGWEKGQTCEPSGPDLRRGIRTLNLLRMLFKLNTSVEGHWVSARK